MIKEFRGKYRWLSNFWYVDGWTVEHLYQASKAKNEEDRKLILNARTPVEAKRLGKKVDIDPGWVYKRKTIMEELVRRKFQNAEMRKNLLETGDEYIQEGNYWHDTFWGVNLITEKGDNELGKIIMKVREELRENA